MFSTSTRVSHCFFFFFFNDTATTEIYTLSLHDALPIFDQANTALDDLAHGRFEGAAVLTVARSEEHTSELQSPCNLVCRLLLEKKKPSGTWPPSSETAQSSPSRGPPIAPDSHVPKPTPT